MNKPIYVEQECLVRGAGEPMTGITMAETMLRRIAESLEKAEAAACLLNSRLEYVSHPPTPMTKDAQKKIPMPAFMYELECFVDRIDTLGAMLVDMRERLEV